LQSSNDGENNMKKSTNITFDEMMHQENPGSFSPEMVEYFQDLDNQGDNNE
jgi:hypothetical protein